MADGISTWQGSCQEDKDSGEWPIFAILTARSLVASSIFGLDESCLDRTETVLFYLYCKVSLATDRFRPWSKATQLHCPHRLAALSASLIFRLSFFSSPLVHSFWRIHTLTWELDILGRPCVVYSMVPCT